jgi:hypothetical protein
MEILHKIWDKWLVVGQVIGDFIARIILTIFYFTIFLPFGLGVRLLADPLAIKKSRPDWVERTTGDLTLDDTRRLS